MSAGRRKPGNAARAGKPKSPPGEPPASTLLDRYHPLEFLDSSPWLLPVLLFLLSLGFRWVFVNAGLFHHDEVLLARAVEATAETGRLTGAYNGRYGSVILNLLLYLPWKAATGGGAGRVVPFTAILGGALLVATVYLLALELTGRKLPGAMAALFLNFNFLFLTTSTTGKENTAQLLFAVLGLYLLLSGAARGSWPRKICGAASFAFSLAVHEAGIPLVPVAALFLLLHGLDRSRGYREIGIDLGLLLLLSAIPFVLYLWDVVLAQLTVRSTHTVGFAGMFSPILQTALKDLHTSCRLPLLLLAAAGVAALARRPLLLAPLLLWVLLIFYYGNVTSYAPRYLVYPLVPISILAGIGADRIVRFLKTPLPQAVAAAFLLLLICGYGIADAYPLIRFRSEYSGPMRMAEYVRGATEPDAIVLTMDESVFIEYYAKRRVMTHPVAALEPNRKFVAEVRALALAGTKVYINSTALSYDYQQHFQRLILENFHVVPVGEVQDEDYHRPELTFTVFRNQLFRLVPK